MDIVLEAKNLTKVYGSGEGTVHALRGVSVGIERGSFTAIIGKSGCGKSTLLQALGGLDAPTSGQVLLEGQSLYDLPDDELAWLRRTKLGFVFQAFNLLPEYTIRDNILLPLMLDKKAVDEAYLKFLTERLGLADLLHRQPGQLSGGQQQRRRIGILQAEGTARRMLLRSGLRQTVAAGACSLVIGHAAVALLWAITTARLMTTRAGGTHVLTSLPMRGS